MGYVGNQTTNSYSSMDKQTITGNGGASYTLTHAVGNAQEIEVFVNNVRQEAGVAYTVSGTALTMTGNVASTDDFYVIYQGKALQTKVPPDGSVSTGKLANGAVTSAKLAGLTSTDMPTGSVLQVVQVTKTDTQIITSNTVEQEISDLAASITPVSTSSKILVTVHLSYSCYGTTYKMYFKRGGSIVSGSTGDSRGSRQSATIPLGYPTDANQGQVGSFSFLDSPASTSQVDYTFFVINDNNLSLFINRSDTDQNNNIGGNYISMVTLTEIAG